MRKYREWQINRIGEIGTGTDCFVVTGPWQVTDELNPIIVIEISALNKLNKQLELTKAFLEAALGDCKDAEVAEEMAGNYKKAMREVEA
jgi:hypothetical protein